MRKNDVTIYVVYGGDSDEREVSLVSGKGVVEAVSHFFNVKAIDLRERKIPSEINGAGGVVFPVLHGEFGEDGGFQRLLEAQGIEYVGCDAASSALCMDKWATKRKVVSQGVCCGEAIYFGADRKPDVSAVFKELGSDLIIKPNNKGSTIGFSFIKGREHLEELLSNITEGQWLIEQRIHGRDLTVGVLNGKAMGIVEMRPKSGLYDYRSKYTAGMTEYLFPAPLDERVEREVKEMAEAAFKVCGCRDAVRVDFMLSNEAQVYFLEINTIPGFTPTSTLPKSASCIGLVYRSLCRELVEHALGRFYSKQPVKVA